MATIKSVPYFNPSSISGCVLWLDAADSTTMTGSAPVTQLRDKSASAITLTVPSGCGGPTLGTDLASKQCLSFNGATPTTMQASLAINLSASFFYAVITTGTYPNDHPRRYITMSDSSAGYDYTNAGGFAITYTNPTSPGYVEIQQNGYASLTTLGTLPASTAVLISFGWNGTNFYTYNNGVGAYSNTTSTKGTTSWLVLGSVASTAGTLAPGNSQNGTYTLNELLGYSSYHSSTTQQQIEAYLTQKWGLTSKLSAGHTGLTTLQYRSIAAPLSQMAYTLTASTMVYTGQYIPYTVPNGCGSLAFNMWGAGGPGGSGGMPGGGGAYLAGSITVTPGEILQLVVGKGGQYGTATAWSTMTLAQGGGGGGGGLSGQGGQGGGRTAIQKYISGAYTEIVTAGGGGSAGGNAGTYGGSAYYSGTSQNAGSTYGQGRTPTGGSATAGGLNTWTVNVGFPWDGTQFIGGYASNAFNVSPVTGACGGGGGGGGYYGGGGGGRSGADTYGGGGGGSYYNATYVTNFSGSNGTSNVAIATGIAGVISGAGKGGAGGSINNGNNGCIVLTPAAGNPVALVFNNYPLLSQTFQYTGANQTFTVPSGVTSLSVSIWGAGGGYNGYYGAGAGAGAYLKGTLTVTPGKVLSFVVGPGGQKFVTYAGSGVGYSAGYPQINVGNGGGRSSVQSLLTSSITAGSSTSSNLIYTTSVAHGLIVGQPVTITGMGTAAYNLIGLVATIPTTTTFTVLSTSAPSAVTGQSGTLAAELVIVGGGGGGGGGNPGGGAAYTGNASAGSGTKGGGGATTSAGGTAIANATAGSLLTGGNGGTGGYSAGGGGGYYGGGGGGSTSSSEGGGGGGSSWYSSLFTFISGANGTSGAPGTSPGTGDTYFANGAGAPQESANTTLGNGLIAISYRAPPS
jgi:hypothetical protein